MFIALRKAMCACVSSSGQLCLSDVDVQLGNKCLLYISCCLMGIQYPAGVLQPEQAQIVVSEVASVLSTPHDPTLVVDDKESNFVLFLRLKRSF